MGFFYHEGVCWARPLVCHGWSSLLREAMEGEGGGMFLFAF